LTNQKILSITFEKELFGRGTMEFYYDLNNYYGFKYDGMDVSKSSTTFILCDKDTLYHNDKVIKFKVEATLDNGL